MAGLSVESVVDPYASFDLPEHQWQLRAESGEVSGGVMVSLVEGPTEPSTDLRLRSASRS